MVSASSSSSGVDSWIVALTLVFVRFFRFLFGCDFWVPIHNTHYVKRSTWVHLVQNLVIFNIKPNNDVFTFGVWKNQEITLQMPRA